MEKIRSAPDPVDLAKRLRGKDSWDKTDPLQGSSFIVFCPGADVSPQIMRSTIVSFASSAVCCSDGIVHANRNRACEKSSGADRGKVDQTEPFHLYLEGQCPSSLVPITGTCAQKRCGVSPTACLSSRMPRRPCFGSQRSTIGSRRELSA
jgi:hypothetical protein